MASKFCCCFTLRTGAITLGWLGLPSSFIVFIATIIGYSNIDYLVDKTNPPDQNIDPAEWKIRLEIILGIILVISIINTIACSTLILGAVRVSLS